MNREKILKESYNLFKERGFKDVTLSDICVATDLTRKEVYHYFSGTSEIMEELVNHLYTYYLTIDYSASAVSTLSQWVDSFKKSVITGRGNISIALLQYSQLVGNELFEERKKRSIACWKELIDFGIKTGEFKETDSLKCAIVIHYLIDGIVMQSSVLDLNGELDLVISRIYDIVKI